MKTIPLELVAIPNDQKLFYHTLVQWMFILLLIFLFAQTYQYTWSSIFILLLAGRYHALGIILHDISHQNLAKSNVYRNLTVFLTGYLLGSSAEAMAYHHIRHHQNSNTQLDPYFQINKNKRPTYIAALIVFLHGPLFMLSWIVRSLITPIVILNPTLKPHYARILLQHVKNTPIDLKELNTCLNKDLPICFFHIALLFLSYHFPFVFMVTYLPLLLTGIMCIWRLYSEHHYDLRDSTHFQDIVRTTFDHHLNKLDSLFFAPLNIGFHKSHHLHPRAAFYQLPTIREWYKINHPGYGE
jgi:fatty acid desaturase